MGRICDPLQFPNFLWLSGRWILIFVLFVTFVALPGSGSHGALSSSLA